MYDEIDVEDIEKAESFKMPPKKEYKVKIRIKHVKKGKPGRF